MVVVESRRVEGHGWMGGSEWERSRSKKQVAARAGIRHWGFVLWRRVREIRGCT